MVQVTNGIATMAPSSRFNLLGVAVDNLSLKELLQEMKSGFVVTPNVSHIMLLQRDSEFQVAFGNADYSLCDSQILMKVARWLGSPIRQKISGSDLLPAYYRHHWDNPEIKMFLLGAQEGIAAIAMRKINQKVGRSIVVDTYSPPWGFENDPIECEKICGLIKQSGASVLVLGLSAPKQEKWFYQYRSKLEKFIDLTLAVGASIDFEAGSVTRSPEWISTAGFEWLYRLSVEPKRLWRRYLLDMLPFAKLVVREKFQQR